MSKTMFYQELTKANTCPECGGFLMLPYFPNGFNNEGITQCSDCDYSKLTKMIPWDKAKKRNCAQGEEMAGIDE